jgi:leucyl aminopeptidase
MANSPDVKVEIKAAIPTAADTVVVLIHEWPGKAIPAANEYATEITALAKADLITGKAGSVTVQLLGNGLQRLIVIGLGDREKQSSETFRIAGGALAKAVKKNRLKSVAILSAEDPANLATGFLLGGFQYQDYKGTATKLTQPPAVKLTFVGDYSAKHKTEIERAVIIADAQNYARTIASRPGNDINPPSLAKVAQQLAKDVGLGVTILDEKKMKQLGMGGMLAVGGGSPATPPRMIVLEYGGKTAKAANGKSSRSSPYLVIGKAITFDTGGISIKQAVGMQKMVFDKCGGMAVLGLMYAVAKLRLPVHIVGILASAENHVSDTAYRPGDILKMYNGVTVEVTNTDAEGRLVLADALAWGIETYKPAAVIDLATLTGGVVVALGKTMASKLTGEKIWRLPIGEDQRDMMKSDPADIMNSAASRDAHPLQGGAFLSYFVPTDGSIPWAHVDIAGVAATEKELPYYAKGATGWGVRTLVEWVTGRAIE